MLETKQIKILNRKIYDIITLVTFTIKTLLKPIFVSEAYISHNHLLNCATVHYYIHNILCHVTSIEIMTLIAFCTGAVTLGPKNTLTFFLPIYYI